MGIRTISLSSTLDDGNKVAHQHSDVIKVTVMNVVHASLKRLPDVLHDLRACFVRKRPLHSDHFLGQDAKLFEHEGALLGRESLERGQGEVDVKGELLEHGDLGSTMNVEEDRVGHVAVDVDRSVEAQWLLDLESRKKA